MELTVLDADQLVPEPVTEIVLPFILPDIGSMVLLSISVDRKDIVILSSILAYVVLFALLDWIEAYDIIGLVRSNTNCCPEELGKKNVSVLSLTRIVIVPSLPGHCAIILSVL